MSNDQTGSNKTELDIIDIIKHQRNRYPVHLIDKVVEGKYIRRKRFPLKMRRIEL